MGGCICDFNNAPSTPTTTFIRRHRHQHAPLVTRFSQRVKVRDAVAAAIQALAPAAVRQEARLRKKGSRASMEALERAIVAEREEAVEEATKRLDSALFREAWEAAERGRLERKNAAAKAVDKRVPKEAERRYPQR